MRRFIKRLMTICCVLVIFAATVDVRCRAFRPAPNVLVLACSAERLR